LKVEETQEDGKARRRWGASGPIGIDDLTIFESKALKGRRRSRNSVHNVKFLQAGGAPLK